MKRWQRIAVPALMLLIAVSSVWHTLRMETLLLDGGSSSGADASPYFRSAMFPEVEVSDIDGLVVIEVVVVEGIGPEKRPVTLAAGIWRATTEAVDTRIDGTHIEGLSERGSRLSWSSNKSRPAYFVVGDFGRSRATLYGREFIVGTNAIVEDHPWSVALGRFGDPPQASLKQDAQ